MNGGRRFRPAIVYMVAEAIGNKDVNFAALGAEYIHTASLIADDLPCMDDDDERRGKPSLHKVYGEAVALLASYSLISAGNSCIVESVAALQSHLKEKTELDPNFIGILALNNAAENTGVFGTTGGQFLDIFPPDLKMETLKDAIRKKTVSLFEVSFVFGYLFGGGDLKKINLVKTCANHFGMAFQIADDISDVDQDAKNGRKVNMACVFGIEESLKMFHKEIEGYFSSLKTLQLDSKELITLGECIKTQLELSHK